MEYELSDLVGDPAVVLIIEWGSVVQHVLPDQRLTITIHKTANDGRDLACSFPESLNYLLSTAV